MKAFFRAGELSGFCDIDVKSTKLAMILPVSSNAFSTAKLENTDQLLFEYNRDVDINGETIAIYNYTDIIPGIAQDHLIALQEKEIRQLKKEIMELQDKLMKYEGDDYDD